LTSTPGEPTFQQAEQPLLHIIPAAVSMKVAERSRLIATESTFIVVLQNFSSGSPLSFQSTHASLFGFEGRVFRQF